MTYILPEPNINDYWGTGDTSETTQRLVNSAYMPHDGLHPDAATYRQIGEFMDVRLREILR